MENKSVNNLTGIKTNNKNVNVGGSIVYGSQINHNILQTTISGNN